MVFWSYIFRPLRGMRKTKEEREILTEMNSIGREVSRLRGIFETIMLGPDQILKMQKTLEHYSNRLITLEAEYSTYGKRNPVYERVVKEGGETSKLAKILFEKSLKEYNLTEEEVEENDI